MPSKTYTISGTFNKRDVFTRFKYAEEFAKGLVDDGNDWAMFRDDDLIEVDTGEFDGVPYREEYAVPQFVVLWNE